MYNCWLAGNKDSGKNWVPGPMYTGMWLVSAGKGGGR